MRIFWPLFFLLIGYFSYDAFFKQETKPLADEELQEVLKSGSAEATKFKASLARVLPKMKQNPLGGLTPGPHVVIIKNTATKMDMIDALDRMEVLKDNVEEEGLSFANWFLSSPDYSPDEKEEFFKEAIKLLPTDATAILTLGVLYQGAHPELYKMALSTHTTGFSEEQAQRVLVDVLANMKDEELRDILYDYAYARGINLPR